MVNTVFSIVSPSYRVWDSEEWFPTPGKCIQGTSLESVNIILSAKRVFAILIQDLEMDRSSRVIQVSLKLYKCPYKRDDGGGGGHWERTRRGEGARRGQHTWWQRPDWSAVAPSPGTPLRERTPPEPTEPTLPAPLFWTLTSWPAREYISVFLSPQVGSNFFQQP